MSNEIDDVLKHIEAHLFAPLSVSSLAAVAGLSLYHFSRLFTARMGDSVMSYVRRRRMEEAALRLSREPRPSLAELAFDCGFESQEAFTRAFARTFGVTPGRFKRETLIPAKPMETFMTGSSQKANVVQQGGLVRHEAFTVAGVAARIETAHKDVIPTLWPKLFHQLAGEKRADWRSYGVCWGADEAEGTFNYMAGVEVSPGATPKGFEAKTIPAQSYLVFRLTLDGGNLHEQMQAAAREIWGERLPKSGRKLSKGPDLEVYPPDFDPSRAGSTVDFWVPVES